MKDTICTMPLKLEEGWNQIIMDLKDLTRKAHGTNFAAIRRVCVHSNCKLRRIYFAETIVAQSELPPEFKLFLPAIPNT